MEVNIIGVLTGTDIVDHLRTFEVEDESGYIKLTKASKERIDKEATHKRIVLKGPVCGIIRIKPWWQALMHKWCCQSMDNFIELCQA